MLKIGAAKSVKKLKLSTLKQIQPFLGTVIITHVCPALIVSFDAIRSPLRSVSTTCLNSTALRYPLILDLIYPANFTIHSSKQELQIARQNGQNFKWPLTVSAPHSDPLFSDLMCVACLHEIEGDRRKGLGRVDINISLGYMYYDSSSSFRERRNS